ncbi:hypothetical protein GCM10009760_63490 [Kitasatospora kazusensis]|uniref:Right handed beta helix domain-containing protein n=1 Tax=Kitasatospora kazusensis TaxID=407974 RepID=A0ABP4KE28_9ACTN
MAGAALLSALAVPVIGQTAANAATTDVYVNNSATAKCTDGGTGLPTAPFCTVQAAADAALPGQTVHIASGQYKDALNITHSGTAAAPISFVASSSGYVGIGGVWDAAVPRPGMAVTGAQHLRFKGIGFSASGSDAVVLSHATDVSVLSSQISGGGGSGQVGVRVGTGSSHVTVAGSYFEVGGTDMVIEQGASDTVVSTNEIRVNSVDSHSGVVALGSPGTVVVSNTINTNCGNGIVLAGASTGAVVENNVVETGASQGGPAGPCAAGRPDTGLTVSAEAAPSAKADYNVISPMSGGPAYDWADTSYQAQAAFLTATGQGAHDFVADPAFPYDGSKPPLAPWIDSADANAPGMLDTDFYGHPAVDDPLVPDTGTGSGFRDRGAQEYTAFGSLYTPASPARLLDTRYGTGAGKAKVQTGGSVDLQVAGVAGVPPTGVTAVTLNVTVTGPTADGFLTVYPSGQKRPTASNLNWSAGTTIANLVTVPVVNGKVSFYAGGRPGGVDVIADLAGYYSGKGDVFSSASPARLLDTRYGTGADKAKVQTGGSVDLQVAGVGGVPQGATAVTLNVTATDPTADGFLTVYPSGQDRPTASNLNWSAGTTIANLVTVPVVNGKVSFYAGGRPGGVDVIADLVGYYGADGYDTYRPTGPWRAMDTRSDHYEEGELMRKAAPVGPGQTLDVDILSGARLHAATLNVTVTNGGAGGYLTVFPSGSTRPGVSNLNWSAGQTIPNQVVVKVGANGKVSFYNGSKSTVDLVVDVFGYQAY